MYQSAKGITYQGKAFGEFVLSLEGFVQEDFLSAHEVGID
jgi:hypothetical protein